MKASYLSCPGIESLLSDYYHQCKWLDVPGNEKLWGLYIKSGACSPAQLLSEVEQLLVQPAETVASFIRLHASASINPLGASEAQRWAENFKAWCVTSVAQQSAQEGRAQMSARAS